MRILVIFGLLLISVFTVLKVANPQGMGMGMGQEMGEDPASETHILMETGDRLLMETGDNLLLE